MSDNKTAHELLFHALSEIYKKTGFAITRLSADWVDTTRHGFGESHELLRVNIGASHIDKPSSAKD